ncbi:MAG: PorP/SprF family type IX secretion system membrane protein [Owenweeksia sp.]
MKKLFLSTLIVMAGLQVEAQQIPLYSNYFFTPYIYNPAQSGTDGSTELTLLHRRQWTDVQGSPETSALAINGSFNEEKVGWSIYGFRDITDIVSRIGVYGNYAYRVNLADNVVLAFGLGAGYLNNQIDQSAIRAREDEAIITVSTDNRGNFDLNAGVNLEISDFTLGFAAPQLLGQSIKYSDNTTVPINYSLLRHYVVSAQYDFRFRGDDNVLSPVVMLKAAKNVPVQFDAGLLFNLKDYGYVGAMYRSEYAVTANVGVNLTEQLTLGYAYDFSLNDFGPELGTSHEFMLTYRFGSNKRNDRLENEIKRLKQQQRKQKDEVEEIVDERLEEFKDEYKREIEKEVKDAAAKEAQSNQNNNNNTGNNGQAGTNNPGNPNGGNPNTNPANSGGNNQSGNGQTQAGDIPGFDASNQANNVQPGSRGYYVTAGVFSSQQNADKMVRKLSSQGLNARYFQDKSNYYYYVYLLQFSNYQQADAAKSNGLNGSYNGELWIKIVE